MSQTQPSPPPLPPRGTLPDPGPLPAVHSLPFRRNPAFTGREQDLLAIADALLYGGRQERMALNQPAAASGLGGVGKTQLAVEFAYRYGRFLPGGVFWVSFAEPDGLMGEIARAGESLPGYPHDAGVPAQARWVQRAWSSPEKRLLIFDNCDSDDAEALLQQHLPRSGGSRVLITSRRSRFAPVLGVDVLPVGRMIEEEAVALLQHLAPHVGAADAAAIARVLGGLPLALDLAGNYLHEYRHGVTATDYLAELEEADNLIDHRTLRGQWERETLSPTDHVPSVARTVALTVDRLQPTDPVDSLARRLLARAACFAPGQPIPRPLLLATVAEEEAGTNPARQGAALNRLTTLGLLEAEEDGAPVIHRLVAAYGRAWLGDETVQRDVWETVAAQADAINEGGLPRPLLAWQEHLRHVAVAAAAAGDGRAGWLWNELGVHLRMVGDYEGARAAFERALAIGEATFGPDHPEVATDVNNLGRVLHDQGDYEGARAAFERALAIVEKALGPDHPRVATATNNLGSVLHDQGDYEGAQAAYERALAIDEAAFGPDHPALAIDVNNLGRVLHDQGDLDGARAAFERALAIDEAAFGPDHPHVARDVNNLGGVLHDRGDYEGAQAAFERALAIDEAAFGPDHPHVAIRVTNLGTVLHDLGDYDGARAAYEQALAIFKKVFGPDHPHTQIVERNLAQLPPAATAEEE